MRKRSRAPLSSAFARANAKAWARRRRSSATTSRSKASPNISRTHPLPGSNPFRSNTLLHGGIPPAARGGLDLALHDLIGKELNKPLYELFGLDPALTPVTSFTIGIADPETTLQKVAEVGDHPILKVKLGVGTPAEQVETIARSGNAIAVTIRIDANEGWDAETAVLILRELERFEIEFCEQPIPAGHPEHLRTIRERVTIPIVTDEDSLVAADLPRLYGCVDGVNVKLAKTGGLRPALEMIHTARAMGMKVMLGLHGRKRDLLRPPRPISRRWSTGPTSTARF